LTVLITGINGQDGSILAHLLEKQGETITGICREDQKLQSARLFPNAELYSIDIRDQKEVNSLLDKIQPRKIFNFLAFSSVRLSWDNSSETLDTNSSFPIALLNWCKTNSPETKYLQASSSEIYGGAKNGPQNEESKLSPITPYGFSKALTHIAVKNYREKFGIFAINAILYNHESPLRKETFVTRKISKAVSQILLGKQSKISLGNTEAQRDWGWAPDYVRAMIAMSEQSEPNDFILSTGKPTSVADLLKYAFEFAGIEDYSKYIEVKSEDQRDVDPQFLFGDSSKAENLLNWKASLSARDIMFKMVEYDLKILKEESSPKNYGWI
jgi:GDPmannose 4,6-dehydratase